VFFGGLVSDKNTASLVDSIRISSCEHLRGGHGQSSLHGFLSSAQVIYH